MNSNINYVNIKVLECQAEIILRALELYAYNLHYTYYYLEDAERLNTMLYYTYETLLNQYSLQQYKIGYNVLSNCHLRSERLKKQNYYKRKKVS